MLKLDIDVSSIDPSELQGMKRMKSILLHGILKKLRTDED